MADSNQQWRAKKSRSNNAAAATGGFKAKQVNEVRSEAARSQHRVGNKWAKVGPEVTAFRSVEERLRKDNKSIREKFEKYVETAKAESQKSLIESSRVIAELQAKVVAHEKRIRSLRRKNQVLAAQKPATVPKEPRKMQGGISAGVKSKVAAQVKNFLVLRFSSKEARQQALYEHFRKFPEDYNLVTSSGIDQAGFDTLCKLNPEWLVPVQKDVIKEIEKHWSVAQALSIQIHCKVGHGENYQDLVHLLAKNFNTKRKGWDRVELYFKGSGVLLPLLPSCGRVDALRAEIHAENPIMQDSAGTAAWLNLSHLVDEAVELERESGFLVKRAEQSQDSIRLHWGLDAAHYFRGVKTSNFGFRLPDLEALTMHAPQQARTVVEFEGKDGYAENKQNLAPCFPVMDRITEDGLNVGGTHYDVVQSLGADYVALSESAGHASHSHRWGCCFCEQESKDYGLTKLDETGRRVPVKTENRTLEKLFAGAHRPLKSGPNECCPYCKVPFPTQEAVDALPAPANPNQETNYDTVHHGMRFGTPPLFKIPMEEWYLCILHKLLRCSAITFQRTIEVNLDTKHKVDAINDVRAALKLGCKKVVVRKKNVASKKDTEPINFIRR
jgi:hypothetical protein